MHNNYLLSWQVKWWFNWQFIGMMGNIAPCERISLHVLHLLHTHISKQLPTCVNLFHLYTEVCSFICIQLTNFLSQTLCLQILWIWIHLIVMEIHLSSTNIVSPPCLLLKRLHNLSHDLRWPTHQEKMDWPWNCSSTENKSSPWCRSIRIWVGNHVSWIYSTKDRGGTSCHY